MVGAGLRLGIYLGSCRQGMAKVCLSADLEHHLDYDHSLSQLSLGGSSSNEEHMHGLLKVQGRAVALASATFTTR